MPRSYRLDPDAEQELAEAMAWYDAERTGLGRELLDEVHAVAKHAAEFSPAQEATLLAQARREASAVTRGAAGSSTNLRVVALAAFWAGLARVATWA